MSKRIAGTEYWLSFCELSTLVRCSEAFMDIKEKGEISMNKKTTTMSLNPEVKNVNDYLEGIIHDVEVRMDFSQHINVEMKDRFEVKKTRNIDCNDKPPIEVTVRNKNNDIKIPVDYVAIMKEADADKHDKMNTVMKQLDYYDVTHLKLFTDYFYDSVTHPGYFRHEKIGWDRFDNKKIFKLHNITDEEGKVIPSAYSGTVKLEQAGTKEDYIKGIRELVIGNERLELILCCSVTGVLSSLMRLNDVNVVLNFTAPSGSGKTCCSKLALSMFGQASKLLMSFNMTENEMENRLGDYSIIPAVIDDKMVSNLEAASKLRSASKMASFLFRLSEGHVKGRMNQINSYKEFNCPVVMTTETSIIDEMLLLKVDGQYCRIIEILCNKGELTGSAEDANRLDEFMRMQGGTIIEDFIAAVIKWNEVDLEVEYERIRTGLKEKLSERGIPSRAGNRIAILLLAAKLINRVFGWGVSVDKIEQLLINNVSIAYSKVKTPEDRYRQLVDYCNCYNEKFPDNSSKANKKEHLGLLRYNTAGKRELWVSRDILNFILTGREPQIYFDGLEDNQKWRFAETEKALDTSTFNNVLSKWGDKGYLNMKIKPSSVGARTEKNTLFHKEKQELAYHIFIKEELS